MSSELVDNALDARRAEAVRDADSGLREHECYAHYHDRADQPAAAHDAE